VSTGGLGGLGFHETSPAGLGRKGSGARVGSLLVLGFSKAAMRSRSAWALVTAGYQMTVKHSMFPRYRSALLFVHALHLFNFRFKWKCRLL
jgi:hypothetical protein